MGLHPLQSLGLYNRAGLLLFGPALYGAKSLGALLVASDASSRSKKEAKALADRTGAKLIEGFTQEELGKPVGRDALSALGIKEGKAAKAIIKALGKENNDEEKRI